MASGTYNTVQQFEVDLKKFAATVNKDISTITKTCVLVLFSNILKRSPIDQGRFVGSWDVEKDRIGDHVLDEDAVDSRTSALAAARARVNSLSFADPFSVYWIYNNLPYAEVIEFGLYPGEGPKTIAGFSTQAPAGVVRVAMADTEARLLEELNRAVRS